jgi:DNA-binding CsgD family transcriptional regulator
MTMDVRLTGLASGDAAVEAIGYSDYAADIAALPDCAAVAAYTQRLSETFGFRFFILAKLPPPDAVSLSDFVLISNMPSDIAEDYDRAGLLQASPGFHRLQTTTTPFRIVIDDDEEASPLTSGYFDRLKKEGVREGYYFPVHDASGGRGVFIMLSARVDLTVAAMTDVYMRCLHLYNRLAAIGNPPEPVDVDLSDREVQCLTWTAAGKTSSEIAEILGLSEHTVNHYLNHVARKLGAVNRVQAVVMAIRLGLIS